jgi:hypothetical protein
MRFIRLYKRKADSTYSERSREALAIGRGNRKKELPYLKESIK